MERNWTVIAQHPLAGTAVEGDLIVVAVTKPGEVGYRDIGAKLSVKYQVLAFDL